MAALSTYYANKIIDHMLRGQAFTPASTVYVALFTSGTTGLDSNNPTNEVSTSGTGYVRQSITLSAAAGGATSNSGQIAFAEALVSYGSQVTHVALVDHASNTAWGSNVNVLAYGALVSPKSVDAGDVLRFDIGELDVAIA